MLVAGATPPHPTPPPATICSTILLGHRRATVSVLCVCLCSPLHRSLRNLPSPVPPSHYVREPPNIPHPRDPRSRVVRSGLVPFRLIHSTSVKRDCYLINLFTLKGSVEAVSGGNTIQGSATRVLSIEVAHALPLSSERMGPARRATPVSTLRPLNEVRGTAVAGTRTPSRGARPAVPGRAGTPPPSTQLRHTPPKGGCGTADRPHSRGAQTSLQSPVG